MIEVKNLFRKKSFIILFCLIFSFQLVFTITIDSITLVEAVGETQSISEFVIKGFSENILLSTEDVPYAHHVEPTIAIGQNDEIFAGWKNADGHNTGGIRVAFTKSLDYGKSWSTIEYMPYYSGILTGQSDPWLVYKNGYLYYAYLEYSRTAVPLSHITVATSTDNGDSWNIVNATGGVGFADKETMTVDNAGNIYVVYDDIDQVNGTVYVRISQSTDNGQSFDEINVIADSYNDPIDHLGPYVTTDSLNNINVAWLWWTMSSTWGDVYITRSTNQGVSFSAPVDINPTTENGTFTTSLDGYPMKGTLPVIRFDSNDRLYCLWAEIDDLDATWSVFLRYSDDYGLTWSDRYIISEPYSGDQWQPDLEIDSQNRLHIVYYDLRGNYFSPFYRMGYFEDSSSTILTITDPIPIADQETVSTFTRPGDYFMVRVDSKDIPHVVWTDGRNNEMDIYYSHGISEKLSQGAKIGLSIGIPLGSIVIITVIVIVVFSKKK